MSGSPASAGDSFARRVMRNSRTSALLSMSSTLRADDRAWGALPVHLSNGTPTRARTGVVWVNDADDRTFGDGGAGRGTGRDADRCRARRGGAGDSDRAV